MSVELTPVELGFRRPFSSEVSETLHLRNPNSEPVAFKVKTTAPKQYCVRPNSGRIEAGGAVEVQVLLQAMKEDPPLEAKCRDKFLVQSVTIGADKEASNISSIWSEIEKTSKSSIQEKKIRVSFLPADGSAPSQTPVRKSVGGAVENPPAYSSPVSAMATPAGRDVKGESAVNGTRGADAGASSSDEIKAQLQAAQTQIANLTRQLGEQAGLRQRKPVASSASTSTSVAPQKAPGGVSVPVTFILCLISFLIAYLLF